MRSAAPSLGRLCDPTQVSRPGASADHASQHGGGAGHRRGRRCAGAGASPLCRRGGGRRPQRRRCPVLLGGFGSVWLDQPWRDERCQRRGEVAGVTNIDDGFDHDPFEFGAGDVIVEVRLGLGVRIAVGAAGGALATGADAQPAKGVRVASAQAHPAGPGTQAAIARGLHAGSIERSSSRVDAARDQVAKTGYACGGRLSRPPRPACPRRRSAGRQGQAVDWPAASGGRG